MATVISKYWIITIVVATFALGMTVGQVAGSFRVLGNGEVSGVNTMSERIEELSGEISSIKASVNGSTVPAVNGSEMAGLEKNIKVINAKLERLKDLADDVKSLEDEIDNLKTMADDISDLKDEIENLKTASVQQPQLRADLDKFEYMAGDSLMIDGGGLPNTSVKISLLDVDGLALSELSTISDSAGKFSFTIQLSKSLSTGTYRAKIIQDQNVVEREFRIVDTTTATSQDLTLSVDKSEVERGDTVLISGKTDASVFVDLDIFDDRDIQIARTSVRSDSSGDFKYSYDTDSTSRLGTYTVKATYGDSESSIRFDVVSSVTSSSSGELTITTEKSEYKRGELVVIKGEAPANSKVTVLVEPPSGDNFLLTVNSDEDGNYRTVFAIKTGATTGTWTLTVTQGTSSATMTIHVM